MADLAGNITSWEHVISVTLGLAPPAAAVVVTIDIRLRSVKPGSNGVIPVVIFDSETFDVREIDVATLGFGPNAVVPAHDLSDPKTLADHLEDRNGDGYLDLMTHFRANQSGIVCDATSATMVGTTVGGESFEGSDTISTVACPSPRASVGLRPGGRFDGDSAGSAITKPERRE